MRQRPVERCGDQANFGPVAALSALITPVQAEDKEPDLVFEMGAAGGWPLSRGNTSYGPEIALEYTAIKHWLEIELGTSPQFSKGRAGIETNFVLKKPFEPSDRLEFLISAGPVWLHKPGADSAAGEVTAEFVYAAWPKEHVSIFFEPSYAYDFGKGHEQSIGFTVGLHIGIN